MKQYKNLLPLLFNTLFLSIALGINFICLPFTLYENHIPPGLIGVASSMEILGNIVIARFVYNISKTIGTFYTMIICATLGALIVLVLPAYYNFALWLLLVFLMGMCWFSVSSTCQSCLNIIVDEKDRVMVIAINVTMICIGLVIGPILVKIIGIDQYLSFIVGASSAGISCFVLLLNVKKQPKLQKIKVDYLGIIKNNPSTFFAKFLLDSQATIALSLTVIYGIKNGLSAEDSGILVSCAALVGLFNFLIGFIIKNETTQKYITLGFYGAIIVISLLPLLIKNYYTAMLVYALYSWFLCLMSVATAVQINKNQNPNDLIAINSTFQAVGACGGLIGGVSAGVLMQILGKNGFVFAIVGINLLYILMRFVVSSDKLKSLFCSKMLNS